MVYILYLNKIKSKVNHVIGVGSLGCIAGRSGLSGNKSYFIMQKRFSSNLFLTQESILNGIESLLNEEKFKLPIKLNDIVNSFVFKNKSYKLTEPMCKEIMDLLSLVPIVGEEEKVILKQYSTNVFLEKITFMVSKMHGEHILKEWQPLVRAFLRIVTPTNYQQLGRIISDLISYHLMEYLWNKSLNKEASFFLTTFGELSYHLGTTCLQWWFMCIKEEQLDKISPLFLDNYVIKGNEEGHELLAWFRELNVLFKKSKQSLQEFFSNTALNPYKINNFQKLSITIGSFFVDHLLIHKILKQIDRKDFTLNRATALTLAEEYQQDIIRATSYYKPSLLCTRHRRARVVKEKENNYHFIIKDTTSMSDNNKFGYEVRSELKDCLNTNEVTYCINTPFLDYYLAYFEYVYQLDWSKVISHPSDVESIEVQDFIYLTYNVNINDLKQILDDKEVNSLLIYMKDLDNIFDIKFSRRLYKNLSKNYKQLKTYIKTHHKQNKLTLKSFIEDPIPDISYETYNLQFERSSLFLTCYNKIVAQKYFIINFLRDAYIYKHFKFFFLERKLTSIGRLQTIPHFISLQTNKFSRAFIIYYTNNNQITEHNFKQYIQIFSDNLPYVKPKLQKLTYAEFQKVSIQTQQDYILSYFSKNIEMDDLFSLDINSLRDVLKILINKKAFKKTQTALLGLSLLYYKENTKLYRNKEPIVFLDSTMSGTQHMASLFRHLDAARNGSLIGNHKYDLNLMFLKEFRECLFEKIPFITNNFLSKLGFMDNELDSLTLENILSKINEKLVLIDNNININTLNLILTNNLKENESRLDLYFQEISNYNLENLNFSLQDNNEMMNQVLCLLTKNITNAISNVENNKNIIKNIWVVLLEYTIKTIKKTHPKFSDLLTHREVIKQRIMATGYGMTTFGGLQTIRHNLLNTAIENGFIDMSRTHLNILAEMISNYFENKFNKEHLSYVTSFLKLVPFLKFREDKALHFWSQYLSWTYRPKVLKQIRYNVARWYFENKVDNKKDIKRRSISIVYKTNDIDSKKINSSFAPLIVQTIEAHLMTNWLISSSKINYYLQNELNIEYFYSPNYDCFGTNYKHAALLKLHLEECYHNTYNYKFKEHLMAIFNKLPPKETELIKEQFDNLFQEKSSPLYWDGIITNPYFVNA